jgi:MarR family 2-MHQ and catechol resistance regulon transcriptional repressor
MKQRPLTRFTQGPAVAGEPGDADLARDAEDLHQSLRSLIRVYQFRDRKRICCHDISVTQCHALELIVGQGPVSMTKLAASLFLDKSTVSRVVGSLEGKGLAARRADPADARGVLLEATAEGRGLFARIEQDLLRQSRRLLSDLDPEVRQATARLIARLAREAEARFSKTDGSCGIVSER